MVARGQIGDSRVPVGGLGRGEMIAFKIFVNGEPVCTAGGEDLGVLNAIVNAVGPLGRNAAGMKKKELADLFLSVGGLTSRGDVADEHLRWAEHNALAVGDRVEILILDACEADEPVSRIAHVPRAL